MTLEDLKLPTRAYHTLRRSGIHTFEQLLEMDIASLCRIHGLGVRGVNQIVEAVAKAGESLVPSADT